LVTEDLERAKCKRKVISWSQAFLDQLDVGHRGQFPIIITYNYACDMRVASIVEATWRHKQLHSVTEKTE